MKRVILVLLMFVAAAGFVPSAFSADDNDPGKVVAYYFHGSFRCATCNAMEKFSREAIDTNFKDAVASGKLEFKSVNVEDRWNEHFVKDYQLYTKTLILSSIKDGKEVKSQNLDKIWEYARNKQKFVDYVTAEVGGFMKGAE